MTRQSTLPVQKLTHRPHFLGPMMTAIAASAILATTLTSAGAANSPVLRSLNEKGFTSVLVNHSSRTLYVLSAEKGGKIKCQASCEGIWPPLLVSSSVMKVNLGPGVKGKVGFIKRGATKKQVTFNSYPLYTFSGDSASGQMNGQGIVADGGTWSLARASATTPGATPMLHSAGAVTTTTSGGGGYGY